MPVDKLLVRGKLQSWHSVCMVYCVLNFILRVIMICLNTNTDTRYTFVVGVSKGGVISTIEVSANTRAQASKIAREAGYIVRDMYIG